MRQRVADRETLQRVATSSAHWRARGCSVGSEVKHDKLGCTPVAISFLVVAENREHIVAHPLIGGSILKGKEEDLNKLMCQGKLLHRRSVICIEEDTQVLGCDTMLLQRGLILNGKAEIP